MVLKQINVVSHKKKTAVEKVKRYDLTLSYAPGDLIEHMIYGKGRVTSIVSRQKFKVAFKNQSLVLTQNFKLY